MLLSLAWGLNEGSRLKPLVEDLANVARESPYGQRIRSR